MDSSPTGDAEDVALRGRRHPGRARGHDGVPAPVVAALEAQQAVTAGGGASGAHGDHHGFTPGAGEAPALGVGHALGQQFGELDLGGGGQPEGGALGERRGGGAHGGREGVAVDERGVVAVQVDQLASVGVEKPPSLPAAGVRGMRRHKQRAARAAAGQTPQGAFVEGVAGGACCALAATAVVARVLAGDAHTSPAASTSAAARSPERTAPSM